MPVFCPVFETILNISQYLKRSRHPDHTLWWWSITHTLLPLLLFSINPQTKSEMQSFTQYKDMIGDKNKNRSRDTEHAHFSNGLSSVARTWYSLHVYKIWRLSAFSEIWLRILQFKISHVTWPRPFQGCLLPMGYDVLRKSTYYIWSL